MATAEITPPLEKPTIESAQQLEPGIQRVLEQYAYQLLSRQEGNLPVSNLATHLETSVALSNPRPPRVLFGALKDPCLLVVDPIPLDVSLEESTVVVTWSDVAEFGTGATLSAAIDDFSGALRELYHQLFASDVKLGADLQKIQKILEQHIQPRK